MQSALEDLKEKNLSLKNELARSQKALTKLTNQYQNSRNRTLASVMDLHCHRAIIKCLQESNSSLRKKINKLELQLMRKEPELTRAQAKNHALSSQLSSCSNLLMHTSTQLSTYEFERVVVNNQQDVLQNDLDTLRKKSQQQDKDYREKIESLWN
ncbi:hypothetical protein ACEPAF_4391 [Sanghuangporus sanghuang]